MSYWGLWCQEGPILAWGAWIGRKNGERFLDQRRKRPKKKAEVTAGAVSFASILLTSHWHKGFRQGQYP